MNVNQQSLPAASTLSDEAAVARILEGEHGLFELLMRRYNQRLYRVSRSIVKDEAEAEDVMQQAYVNAYQHLEQFGGRASFATWLTRIAVHEALARVRRRDRIRLVEPGDVGEESPVDNVAEKGPNPEHQAFTTELRSALEQSLDELPVLYRTVFMMREVEGLSTSETAVALEVSEETVKTRLHRARLLLRDRLFERAGLAAPESFTFGRGRCDRVVAAVMARLDAGRP